MARIRRREVNAAATPGWIDTLPSGGQIRMDPSVPTAAELVSAATEAKARTAA